MALARPYHRATDGHLNPEDLVVVGPGGGNQAVLRLLAGETLRVLLESALWALQSTERTIASQLGRGQGGHEPAGGAVPEIQVDGADEGLEGGREQGRPAAAAPLRFALTEQQIL